MDWTTLFLAMSIPSAITGFCFWLLERRIQRREEKAKEERDKREAERKQYELCNLKMISASMALAEATAKAVERIPDAHCNGDMHAAIDYAAKIKREQKEFLQKHAVNSIDL